MWTLLQGFVCLRPISPSLLLFYFISEFSYFIFSVVDPTWPITSSRKTGLKLWLGSILIVFFISFHFIFFFFLVWLHGPTSWWYPHKERSNWTGENPNWWHNCALLTPPPLGIQPWVFPREDRCYSHLRSGVLAGINCLIIKIWYIL